MERPHVIVGAHMSVDGKTAPRNLRGLIFATFMNDEVVKKLHQLRSEVDAVLVGLGTVLTDNPRLTVRKVKGENPIRIVLDSKARIPLNSAVINVKEAPTILAVSKAAPKGRIDEIQRIGVEVVKSGDKRVELVKLLPELYERGIRRLLVEGGSEVRWSFFRDRMVDELFICVMPAIWGGRSAPTLVDGEGFVTPEEAVQLKLKRIYTVGKSIIIEFYVEHR